MVERYREYQQRRKRFHHACRELGTEIVVISDRKTVYYLSGYLRPDLGPLKEQMEFMLLKSDSAPVLLVGESRRSQASQVWTEELMTFADYDIQHHTVLSAAQVAAMLEHRLRPLNGSVKGIGVEASHLPMAVRDVLTRVFPAARFVDVTPLLACLRMIKDGDEIALLRRAASMIEVAYATARISARPGVSEIQLYAEIELAVTKSLGQPALIAGDIVSAERTLNIGGFPTSSAL